VQYLHRFQKGLGASSVSFLYAERCHQKYDLLWQLPAIVGLPNPMPDEERVNLPRDAVLHEFKVRSGFMRGIWVRPIEYLQPSTLS
jgi:hypothetical protein